MAAQQEQQINDAIRDREVRVVGVNNEQLGIMSSRVAMRLAQQKNLDLVKIAPMAKPPVCRIMDYGKFKYEQSLREKEQRKNQKAVELKEIRLSSRIDKHDFDTKANQARGFLSGGHKLKVSIRFRGRENAHTDLGKDVMDEFAKALADVATVERAPRVESRQMLMFLAPKPPEKEKKAPKEAAAPKTEAAPTGEAAPKAE
ncbi:MAG: translation initiation factor IF-3 [Oscillospiraceae bacterium]|nr:translation initiation factor IF-3 [Oscillospiraceae bacterium]